MKQTFLKTSKELSQNVAILNVLLFVFSTLFMCLFSVSCQIWISSADSSLGCKNFKEKKQIAR